MDSDHLPGVQTQGSAAPKPLHPLPPQAGGTRGVTVESRHPPSTADPQSTPLGFRAVPAAIQPCPLELCTRAGRVARAPPSSDPGASVLNPRARVPRPLGSAEQASG